MKGLVKVTPESLSKITDDCARYINSINREDYATKKRCWSWRKFKMIDVVVYEGLPFWYQYKVELIDFLLMLNDMTYHGDEIWLSELSYCHLLMLSKGDKNANPIYIMDY
jgi:hypothetical protein